MSKDNWSIGSVLRHPVAAISAGLAAVTHGFGVLDPVFGIGSMLLELLGATAGTWFPLLGVMSTLGDAIAWIPAVITNNAFVVGAIVYALYLSDSLIDRVANYVKKDKKS